MTSPAQDAGRELVIAVDAWMECRCVDDDGCEHQRAVLRAEEVFAAQYPDANTTELQALYEANRNSARTPEDNAHV